MKRLLLKIWSLDSQIRGLLRLGFWLAHSVPLIGRALSLVLDRLLLIFYGLDVTSRTIRVRSLSVGHPVGVLLGGNGIRSNGTVIVNAGVKFVGHSPRNERYLQLHKEQRVFELGHNVVIGANSTIVGPVRICDNVVIATMSLVNKDITEPGLYAGIPVKRISDRISTDWLGDAPSVSDNSRGSKDVA